MPERLPNTMNNYGLVLNDIGLRGLFSRILEQVRLNGDGMAVERLEQQQKAGLPHIPVELSCPKGPFFPA